MKTFLVIASMLLASATFAQSIDGKYKVVSVSCQSGIPANPNDVAVAKAAVLELSGGNLTLTIDASSQVPGCSIVGTGIYSLAGNQFKTQLRNVVAAPACGSGPMPFDSTEHTATVTISAQGFTMDSVSANSSVCPPNDHEIDVYTKLN